jgi:hypothetical protein
MNSFTNPFARSDAQKAQVMENIKNQIDYSWDQRFDPRMKFQDKGLMGQYGLN